MTPNEQQALRGWLQCIHEELVKGIDAKDRGEARAYMLEALDDADNALAYVQDPDRAETAGRR